MVCTSSGTTAAYISGGNLLNSRHIPHNHAQPVPPAHSVPLAVAKPILAVAFAPCKHAGDTWLAIMGRHAADFFRLDADGHHLGREEIPVPQRTPSEPAKAADQMQWTALAWHPTQPGLVALVASDLTVQFLQLPGQSPCESPVENFERMKAQQLQRVPLTPHADRNEHAHRASSGQWHMAWAASGSTVAVSCHTSLWLLHLHWSPIHGSNPFSPSSRHQHLTRQLSCGIEPLKTLREVTVQQTLLGTDPLLTLSACACQHQTDTFLTTTAQSLQTSAAEDPPLQLPGLQPLQTFMSSARAAPLGPLIVPISDAGDDHSFRPGPSPVHHAAGIGHSKFLRGGPDLLGGRDATRVQLTEPGSMAGLASAPMPESERGQAFLQPYSGRARYADGPMGMHLVEHASTHGMTPSQMPEPGGAVQSILQPHPGLQDVADASGAQQLEPGSLLRPYESALSQSPQAAQALDGHGGSQITSQLFADCAQALEEHAGVHAASEQLAMEAPGHHPSPLSGALAGQANLTWLRPPGQANAATHAARPDGSNRGFGEVPPHESRASAPQLLLIRLQPTTGQASRVEPSAGPPQYWHSRGMVPATSPFGMERRETSNGQARLETYAADVSYAVPDMLQVRPATSDHGEASEPSLKMT